MAMSVARDGQALVGREKDPGSPEDDDGAVLREYVATMSDRVADGLVAVTLALALVFQLVADEPRFAAVSVLCGLALTLPLALRRRAPVYVAGVYVVVAVLQGVIGGDLFSGHPPAFGALAAGCVSFYSLGAHAGDRPAAIGLALGITGLWISVLVTDDIDVQSFLFSGGLIALAPWLAGRVTRNRALRIAALEREREQRGLTAASEERQRIARELHDVVAHGVVLMVLQAQGARRILDSDPGRAREALDAIEETGQTALTEIRASLGMLRGEDAAPELRPQPRLGDLGALVAEMRDAGLAVDLTVEGPERELAVGVDRAAYRVVQEALTNAIRHAGPVPTHVTVSYRPESLLLEVVDEGPGPTGENGHGNGIAGMRERVRVHGGELEARPGAQRGFVVRARIPL
jgi:signal transduction histidine kinase